ncbi:hypothetical protein LUW75_15020 [Streptomyces sp. MRC013]|uniref:hypothetical protein n=1 Tax=Streptomyces sp. MRC013 TaxID=2898276 RepID=UPI0020272A95|nr:hypothetical protein [Streptomyces sp. MRC013]URM91080.1 hypothetical protein LUW75_15020 [Streptomyces sp. MRC013]
MSEDDRDRGPRRRRGARWAAVATAAAVVAGGAFWLSGGYDAWSGGGPALDGACEGHLAADPVRALLPDSALSASSELRQDGWRCSVSAPGGEAGVEVRVRNAAEPLGPGARADPGEGAVPLGGGWTGSFSYGAGADAARGRAVLLLDCGDESGDGLLAVADGRLARGASFEDGAARTRLVSALADTARSYARRTGCTVGRAVEGTVRDVAVPVVDPRRPLARASGTCRGVVDAATARRWGAGTAAETPARPAPVERCVLGSGLGSPLYTFTASYGPYGETALSGRGGALPANGAARSPSGRYRLTAECPGADGTGVYEIVPDDGLALDHASLRTALKAFAAASAGLHHCRPPA